VPNNRLDGSKASLWTALLPCTGYDSYDFLVLIFLLGVFIECLFPWRTYFVLFCIELYLNAIVSGLFVLYGLGFGFWSGGFGGLSKFQRRRALLLPGKDTHVFQCRAVGHDF
jgi:hypothetical protein